MAHGSVARAVAGMLDDAGFVYVHTAPPSALDCAEPIVCLQGHFERDGRMEGEERGTVAVSVLVVRELAVDAEAGAEACELALRRCDWEPWADCGRYRIVALDTTAPAFVERDRSGRVVWGFEVRCTVARSL
ncbi:MAG: hypothetical protein J6D54_12780 [Olsenella sp.]|nr:hypothetical protein [Olsenella sp.]